MAYIGRRPLIGNYIVLDAISPSATTTFNLTQSGSAYSPQLAQNCIVSVNGVIQAPNTSYTISGSTIVFSTALSTTDTINFITVLGDVQNVGTPTAGTVTAASFATGFNGVVTWQNVQTTNFTAVAGRGYPVNTTSAGITVTLPSSAVAGNTIQIVDYAGTAATNNITIAGNGNNVNGKSNFYLFQNREAVTITYIDATQGWLAGSAYNEGQVSSYTASYLIVAGGGSGGNGARGGGGGAGGLLTSTTTLTPSTVYTATIGGGGVLTASYDASNASGSSGVSGSNSSLVGGSVSITTTGGGGGQVNDNGTALSGGSGGGAWTAKPGGSGTSGQGYAGGTGAGSANYGAGGGGGSGGVGGNGSTSVGGNGGAGTTSSITGSSVTYAGGGSGDILGSVGHAAGTATGGGGVGNNTNPTHQSGTDATANTGGGGGSGGSGGSGVIILSVPTANYSGITTGSPTITTSGSNTIIKFTATGTYTA
jgi:hypothetical protein